MKRKLLALLAGASLSLTACDSASLIESSGDSSKETSVLAAAGPNCSSRTLVTMGHADDALAFMHDSVDDVIDAGGCVDFVSMTSFYDDETVVFTGREEGARALYCVGST